MIIALDQGTTSSRAIAYDLSGKEVAASSRPLGTRFPQYGWVEQEPEEIWGTQIQALREVVNQVGSKQVLALGITNQRETVVAWDPLSGKALAPAVVWQCRRSARICDKLRREGMAQRIREKTGLVIDPYFSASKIKWLIENSAELKKKRTSKRAVFGTVDSWILYKLTSGESPGQIATEPSNASRTMLYSLQTADWDEELLALFGVSRSNLPKVLPSACRFGETRLFSKPLPITGILGDQQASLLGHGCLEKGSAKCTFGTGAFLLMNTAEEFRTSMSGLLSTVSWGIGDRGEGEAEDEPLGMRVGYALEGSVFIAGAVVQWLRDKLGIISGAEESEDLARSVPDSGGLLFVPAFVGLGAPHWKENVRGAVLGITHETKPGHIMRAAFEGVAHQVCDLLRTEEFSDIKVLCVDGGMSANTVFCQTLADVTGISVRVSPRLENTAFGAARIAALGAGLFGSLEEARERFGPDALPAQETKGYDPLISPEQRALQRQAWTTLVSKLS